MTGEHGSEETPRHSKPDGSAWKAAQKEMAERNDAAQKRGIKERADREREEAVKRLRRERAEDAGSGLQ